MFPLRILQIKKFIIFCLFWICLSDLNAQITADTIEVKKTILGGTHYIYGKKRLVMPGQFLKITEGNDKANLEIKKARMNLYAGIILTSAGLVTIGAACISTWPAGIFGQPKPDITFPIVAGSGLVIAAVPFGFAYNKHILNGVRLYNNSGKQSDCNKVSMNLSIIQNGIGIVICF